nr:MAG TPA: hypothetical protein [Caudoviricetes sp.]
MLFSCNKILIQDIRKGVFFHISTSKVSGKRE